MRRFWKSTDAPPLENSLHPPLPRIYVRYIRIAAFNALLIVAALALIGVAGEAYFRLIVVPNGYGLVANPKDFEGRRSWRFFPNVGVMLAPNWELRHTNHLDFWTIARTNSLGIFDREPISAERAAESCHIALIGDSFVQAEQVAIADKVQVKLEEFVARELPHLDVVASAFARGGAGQINQLAFYDEYARHMSPNVVALAFVSNDFRNNSTIITALEYGLDPDHMPRVTAAIGADGAPELRPPDPDFEAFRMAPPFNRPQASSELAKYSYLARWMEAKIGRAFGKSETRDPKYMMRQADLLSRRPRYSALFQGWTPTTYNDLYLSFAKNDRSPVFEEAMAYTKFALEQFKRRAARDGATLVILTTHVMGTTGNPRFDRLSAMAEELNIPLINQHDYIIGIGASPRNAEWKHDWHWNRDGHRWAAEALLEWLRDNQEVCSERG